MELLEQAATSQTSVRRRGVGRVPLLLVAALLVGAVAFWPRGESDETGSPTDPALPAVDQPTTTAPAPVAPTELLASAQPLPAGVDALRVIVETDEGSRLIDIGSSGAATAIDFDFRSLTPDPAGVHIAAIDDDGILWAGHPERLTPVDTSVTGFEWHDNEPGSLVYSTIAPNGEPEIVEWLHGRGANTRSLVGSTLGTPVWFGRGGYAVINPQRQVLWLRQSIAAGVDDGGEVRQLPFGRIVAGGPDGSVYFSGDTDSLVVDWPTGEIAVPEYLANRRLTGGALSPLGDRVALLAAARGRNHTLLLVGPDGPIGEPLLLPRAASLAWSRDGRTLAFAGDGTVGFVAVPRVEAVATAIDALTVWDLPVEGTVKYVRMP